MAKEYASEEKMILLIDAIDMQFELRYHLE
jgi:hypothetical protein